MDDKALREAIRRNMAHDEPKKDLIGRIEELEEKLLSATMDGYDMAKHEYRDRIEELEAKMAMSVNFIVFLDKNYRHAFGDTARQKIRELYAELKAQNDE